MAEVGRPTKYHPGLIAEAEAYIKDCPNTFPSLVGFAMVCGIPSKRLQVYKALVVAEVSSEAYPRLAEFQVILDRLHDKQCLDLLDKGATREIDAGIAKLVLGKHGYHNTTDITSNGESIKPTISIG